MFRRVYFLLQYIEYIEKSFNIFRKKFHFKNLFYLVLLKIIDQSKKMI